MSEAKASGDANSFEGGSRQRNGCRKDRGREYASILSALDSIPWSLASEVTPLRPTDRNSLDFFPGHHGYEGAVFPVGGIMMVGNNFSTTKGWGDYCASPDRDSPTKTWRQLRPIIKASGVPLERFWFTNYCHGALVGDDESYEFPGKLIKALDFARFFEHCVAEMRPMLVVSLGVLAARYLRTDYAFREKTETRTIAGHQTKLLAAVHPSAWKWQNRGFTKKDHLEEGVRIGEAARNIAEF